MSFFHFNSFNSFSFQQSSAQEQEEVNSLLSDNISLLKECIQLFDEVKYLLPKTIKLQNQLKSTSDIQLLIDDLKLANVGVNNQPVVSRDAWTSEEHINFVLGLAKFGPKPQQIVQLVPNKNRRQISSHLQKYELKIKKIVKSSSNKKIDYLPLEFVQIFIQQLKEWNVQYNLACQPLEKQRLEQDQNQIQNIFCEISTKISLKDNFDPNQRQIIIQAKQAMEIFIKLQELNDPIVFTSQYACEQTGFSLRELAIVCCYYYFGLQN